MKNQQIIMPKETKPFTPYPTRPIRMSDKTWNKLKKQKLKTGKNWDNFLKVLLDKLIQGK